MAERTVCEQTIEAATADDLSAILHIEEACFSVPWTRKMFEAELTGNTFAHFLVARRRDADAPAVVTDGYLCFWIVFEELRMMNLAVVESMRRRGIATQLVMQALQTGLEQGSTKAVLEVRASNLEALALYEKLGFRRIATRAQYYTKPVEDAVLMEMEPICIDRSPT